MLYLAENKKVVMVGIPGVGKTTLLSKMEEIIKGKSGVRAQALDNNGCLVDDFLIKKTPNSIHIINAPSPAATACLAIADEVVNRIFKK